MIISYVCTFVLALAMLVILVQYLDLARLKKSTLWGMLTLAVAAGAILSFFVDPPDKWDLYKHFQEIERIRAYGNKSWFVANYENLPVTMALFWIVAYLPAVNFLPVISLGVIGGIIIYILKDYSSTKEDKGNQWILVAFFCCIAYMNIVMSISGVRNTMAAAISAVGVYIGIQKRKRIAAIVFFLLAAGIHPQGIMLPCIYFANFMLSKLKIKSRWFMLLILPVIMWIARFFEDSQSDYLQYIFYLVNVYKDNSVVVDSRIVVLQVVAVTVFLLNIKYCEKNEEYIKTIDSEYVGLMRMYLLSVLGSLGNGLLFYRMLYPVGILMIPQIYRMLCCEKNSKVRAISYGFLTIIWCALLIYNGYELYRALS